MDLGEGVIMSLVLYLLSVELTYSVFQQQALSNFLITISLFLLLSSYNPLQNSYVEVLNPSTSEGDCIWIEDL